MAIEPVFEEVKLDSRKRLAVGQTVAEARLLPAPGVAIARVLSVSADSAISSSEVFTGEARYTGRVNYSVLFTDADGRTRSLEYSADFSDKIESPEITASASPAFSSRVLDTDVVSVTSGEIKLASVTEIALDADVEQTRRYLSSGGEGLYTHDDNLTYSRLAAKGGATFEYSAEIGGVTATEIASAEHRVIIKDRTAGADFITVAGVIVSDVFGPNDDGLITAYRLETPFSEEIEAAGARPGDAVAVTANLGGTATLEAGEQGGVVELGYALGLDFCVYADESVTVIADAFSVTHELIVTAESVEITRNKPSFTVIDRVDGNVALGADMPVVDSVLAITGRRVNVASVSAGEGEALIEGVLSCNVIYYNAELASENAAAVELPFSLKARCAAEEGDELFCRGEALAVTAKIRRGNELALSAEIAFDAAVSEMRTETVITGLGEGEERELPTAAFSVHIVRRGESLWDVARTLGTTPELVMMQNPDLVMPLSGGERVVLYRHLTK